MYVEKLGLQYQNTSNKTKRKQFNLIQIVMEISIYIMEFSILMFWERRTIFNIRCDIQWHANKMTLSFIDNIHDNKWNSFAKFKRSCVYTEQKMYHFILDIVLKKYCIFQLMHIGVSFWWIRSDVLQELYYT